MTKPYPHMLVRNIDPAIHQQLRIWSVEQRKSLAQLVRYLVEQEQARRKAEL